MPSREFSRTTPDRSVYGTRYKGDPGEVQIDRRTRQVGKPGYYECPMCGNWARIKKDGTMYTHLTGGLANGHCPYVGLPKGQTDQVRVFYTMTFEITREVVIPDLIADPRMTLPMRNRAFKDAILNDIPEVLEFRPDGAEMELRITGFQSEVVSKEDS